MVAFNEAENKVVAAPNLTPEMFSNSPRFKFFNNKEVTPRTELLTVKHYTDRDEFYKETYAGADYDDIEGYQHHSFTPGNTFYNSDLFRDNRYFGRHRNSKPNMMRYKTAPPRI